MAEPPTVHTLVVPRGVGRIDRWLAGELVLSRAQVQGLIADGHITAGDQSVRASRSLAEGTVVQVEIPEKPETDLVTQDLGIPILYEDADVLVVNKAVGVVVHPARGHPDGTLVNGLLGKLKESGDLPGHPMRPGIVHRLDKGTSGVMVVARTQRAYASLTAQFAAHTVDRRYLTVVWGHLTPDLGCVDAPLARHPRDRIRFAVVDGGKRAVTHWRVVERIAFKVGGGRAHATVVECRLETGRTHQVRVHMASLGHPIVGDPMYHRPVYRPRSQVDSPLRELLRGRTHQMLHARLLGFDHPVTDARRTWEQDPPPAFSALLEALRGEG